MAQAKPKTFSELYAQKKKPKGIVGIFNEDKDRDYMKSSWRPVDTDPMKLPIFRMILAGPPGVGKTTVIKNVLLHNRFKKIWVVQGSKYSEEWKNLGPLKTRVLINKLPPEEKLTKPRRCLILDDCNFKQWSKADKSLLAMIFRNMSSHHGLCVFISTQVFIDIEPTIRRCANIFVLWKTPDMLSSGTEIFKKAGLNKDKSNRLFALLDKNMHHSVTIDLIPGLNEGHPIAPVRLNMTDNIVFKSVPVPVVSKSPKAPEVPKDKQVKQKK